MSSFLKTSFIHDETAPSKSLGLHLKRSFNRQHHLHFFLIFSNPRPSPCIVCFALGLHQRQTGIAGNELVGPCPTLPMPRGALWRLDRLPCGRSPASWSTGVWVVTEPDACARSELRNQFSFFVENVRFVIFHPKLALPPPPVSKCITFRKKLRTYEMLPDWLLCGPSGHMYIVGYRLCPETILLPKLRSHSEYPRKAPPCRSGSVQQSIPYGSICWALTSGGAAPAPANLTSDEQQALHDLQSQKGLVIRPADKGSAIVVQDADAYHKEVMCQLLDRRFLKALDVNPADEHQEAVRDVVGDLLDHGVINQKTARDLVETKVRSPHFYTLPKIHKSIENAPERPIVSSYQAPTERISAQVLLTLSWNLWFRSYPRTSGTLKIFFVNSILCKTLESLQNSI